MADQYGLFWNSVSGDRKYDADSFAEWLGKFFTTGVFNGELQVTPTSGMVVNVGSGYANINGKVRFFDTDTSITLAPASGVYPRIDTIVVRADYTNREITLEYITGAYSGNDPQPTAPTRNASMHEIVLAQILVSAGSTEVTASDITDTRANSEICGWVTGTVDHVAVSQLTEQAQAQFEAWFDHMKGQLSEDAAGNLQLQIDDINDGIGDTDISAIGDGTLTGAVDSINKSLTTETGRFTKVSSKISSVEFARYVKWGRLCVANVNFTVGTTISNATETLFTGLPAAVEYKRFIATQIQSKNGVYARLEVNSSGEIRNAYTNGNISTGQYEGVIAYITSD